MLSLLFALLLGAGADAARLGRSPFDPRPFMRGDWNGAFQAFRRFSTSPVGLQVLGPDSPWRQLPADALKDLRGLSTVSPILYELSAEVQAGRASGDDFGRWLLEVER